MTNPFAFSTNACGQGWPSALRVFGFLRLRDGRFRQRRHNAIESLRAFVGFQLARFVDELLALCAHVGLFSFGFGHDLILLDLPMRYEMRR